MKVTIQECVADTIAVHGYADAAMLFKRKLPFSLFYGLAFGRAPRKLSAPTPLALRLRVGS